VRPECDYPPPPDPAACAPGSVLWEIPWLPDATVLESGSATLVGRYLYAETTVWSPPDPASVRGVVWRISVADGQVEELRDRQVGLLSYHPALARLVVFDGLEAWTANTDLEDVVVWEGLPSTPLHRGYRQRRFCPESGHCLGLDNAGSAGGFLFPETYAVVLTGREYVAAASPRRLRNVILFGHDDPRQGWEGRFSGIMGGDVCMDPVCANNDDLHDGEQAFPTYAASGEVFHVVRPSHPSAGVLASSAGWRTEIGGGSPIRSGPIFVAHGLVLVVTEGHIYAVCADTGGGLDPNHPWPRIFHDNWRTNSDYFSVCPAQE